MLHEKMYVTPAFARDSEVNIIDVCRGVLEISSNKYPSIFQLLSFDHVIFSLKCLKLEKKLEKKSIF